MKLNFDRLAVLAAVALVSCVAPHNEWTDPSRLFLGKQASSRSLEVVPAVVQIPIRLDEHRDCCLPLDHVHTPGCVHGGHGAMMAEEARELTAVLEKLEKFPPLRYPLIHWAALMGRVDLARRVLALEPDPDELDMFGFTALDRINEGGGHGDIDGMLRYLLSVGGTYNFYE